MTRLTGAFVRAFLTMLLVATPAILLPGISPDGGQVVALVALFAGALVLFEYGAIYPSLIEFRDAPPFNRIRFLSLFATIFLISIICRELTLSTPLGRVVAQIGLIFGQLLDFPYSPVRLMTLLAGPNASDLSVLLGATAGFAVFNAMISVGIFALIFRLQGWPNSDHAFNVWVNLPTFDPSAGGDVVARLRRDGHLNIALGALLPFVLPAMVKAGAHSLGVIDLNNHYTLIWIVSAWAFLPASLFMRGIALVRIAEMIRAKRRRAYAAAKQAEAAA